MVSQESKDNLLDAVIRAGILESGEITIEQLEDVNFLVYVGGDLLRQILSEKKVVEKKLYFAKPRNKMI